MIWSWVEDDNIKFRLKIHARHECKYESCIEVSRCPFFFIYPLSC